MLIYCRTGRRSADAAQKLEAQGYTRLRDLGGILSWPYEIEGDFEGIFKGNSPSLLRRQPPLRWGLSVR